MTNKTKYMIYRYLIPLIIFLLLMILLELSKPAMQISVKLVVAVVITYMFMPKIREVHFLSGNNYQIRWLLFGKVILLPKDDSFKKRQ